MFTSSVLRISAVLAALAPLTAADILTVGPAGSGAQFTQIQAAVNAAADDDVILVRPGSYQRIVVEKPVRILGDGTGGVFLPNGVVRNIAAGGEVVLSGLIVGFTGTSSLLLQNCAGTVVLQSLVVDSESQNAVRIENCRRAVLLGSQVHGGVSGVSPSGSVHAQDSEVWIAGSEIIGSVECCTTSHPSPGVEVVNSTLHVWRSTIRGGFIYKAQWGGDGGTGIKAVGSSVDLFGGPGARVQGESASLGLFGQGGFHGGPGLDLAQSSHARIQQALPVSGGFDSDGSLVPAIVVDGTSSYTLDSKVFPTLVASAQQVQLGSSFSLTLEGNPGGYQVLFLSLRTGPTHTPRGVDGFGLLDRANLFKIISEVLPASGTLAVNVNVPSTTSLLGSTLFFQAAERFPNGLVPRNPTLANRFAIGNPVLVTITR